ncbi:hypothetical protein L207DRAFT_576281 [Hyaloscypha variabilis F]|uniref:Uncharacterized protein n=1 Tax=Hyaloscypha variabilis (strain UAMH 11265 / GT02V1 / F) TaxID=1149755 RepID=A0A2J6S9R4_HYAVF|nr:hypothetical protein L207DRAFT_576281 [Hyaloscypha variabilis F]
MSNPPRTRISQMNEEQFEQRVRDLEAEVNRRIAQKGENERPSSRPVTQRTTYLTRTERRESQVSRTCAVPTQPAQPSNNSRSRLPVEGSRTSSQKQCSHCEKCRGRNYEPESSWGISFNNGQMHVGGLRGWEGFNKRMKALKQVVLQGKIVLNVSEAMEVRIEEIVGMRDLQLLKEHLLKLGNSSLKLGRERRRQELLDPVDRGKGRLLLLGTQESKEENVSGSVLGQ